MSARGAAVEIAERGGPLAEIAQRGGPFAEIAQLRGLKMVRRLTGGGGWNETWLAERDGERLEERDGERLEERDGEWQRERQTERLAVRLDTPAVSALGLDRALERDVLRSIQGRGIGPEVAFSDIGRGVLATRWLPGRACAPAHLGNPRLLRALGVLLQRLHRTVAAPRGVAPLDLSRAAVRYATLVGGLWARTMAREVHLRLKAAAPASRRRPPALCHNDPVAQNILRGPSLRLIDWEFSAPGDPLFDLAVVVGHHGLDPGQARTVLAAARGRAHPSERRALAHLVDAYGSLRLLWEAAARAAMNR